jgi:8-oxo-dGTP diphosphatase
VKGGAVIDVAAAVLVRADGCFLLAQRPATKVYAGYWEFPGGKLEPGEPPAQALARELHEELGLDVEQATPWLTRVYAYPHGTVRLRFFRVRRWTGDPHGREGQAFSWQRLDAITVAPMLPANAPVLRALGLPTEYGLSNAGEVGDDAFAAALGCRLAEGLRLVQLREKAMPRERLARLAARVVTMVRGAGGIVLVNADEMLAREAGAHGVHLTATRLAAIDARPPFDWVGASVHTRAELRKAERLGIDLAVLGPVHPTPSHPGVPALGWDGFERIARDAAIPVFAIGGLAPADLERAWTHGAHGIAMIRGAWKAGR